MVGLSVYTYTGIRVFTYYYWETAHMVGLSVT